MITNVKLRFYKIDIFNLYNYKIHKELSSIIYNDFLTISLVYVIQMNMILLKVISYKFINFKLY